MKKYFLRLLCFLPKFFLRVFQQILYIESILITEDRDPTLALDEHRGRLATVYIATGKAALEGADVLHAATLTLHEQETVTTPPCELEINDQDDLG